MELNKIYEGDCLEVLKTLPDESIDCCVTSPPYYGLRDYGTAKWQGGDVNCEHQKVPDASIAKSRSTSTIGYAENTGHSLDNVYKDFCRKCGAKRIDNQIGLEETPEKYVLKMVQVFSEVKRVLKNEGTLWLNLGDSYAANRTYQVHNTKGATEHTYGIGSKVPDGLKPKDLIGIPWMVAFALRSSGWYLRQDIIWHKPNPMPESVTDRCTKSHEYIFLMSKSAKYYYDADAIKTPMAESSLQRLSQDVENQNGSDRVPGKTNGKMKAVGQYVGGKKHKNLQDKGLAIHTMHKTRNSNGQEWQNEDGKANKRSVWTVNTMPYSEAHFATFPERLIVDCIKAGCPEFVCNKCGKAREVITEREAGISKECPKTQLAHEARGGTGKPSGTVGKSGGGRTEPKVKYLGLTDCGCNAGFSSGVVLDPFSGAGTTALVSRKLNRNYIGIELNPAYIEIAEKRLNSELGMFA